MRQMRNKICKMKCTIGKLSAATTAITENADICSDENDSNIGYSSGLSSDAEDDLEKVIRKRLIV